MKNNRRMKPGELKRALALLSVLCIFLFIYLYWQQSSFDNITPQIVNLKRTLYTPKRTIYPPQWTWQCINQRCERRHVKTDNKPTTVTNLPIVSLSTCSMLCGSTQLWPQPTGPVTLGSRAVTFNHQQFEFETDCQGAARSLIQESFGFFNENIVNLVQNRDYLEKTTNLNRVLIRVSVVNVNTIRLNLETNEGYNLTIKPYGGSDAVLVDIRGKTYFGIRHGLETLSQLIWWDEYANNGYGSLKILKGATIQDTPVFPYRGVMVDTARNFMTIDSLKRVIVGMAANKLNIFHWHITDSQSFPMLSNRVPQLAKTGAYSKELIYTPDDIKDFVEFARLRGIRVLLEIDTPAHAGNGWTWGPQEGLGELAVCVNERPWSLYCGEPPCGQLNPDNPNVYHILEKLYRDLLDYTNEHELFHLGGDEVNLECWAQHLNKNKQLNYTDLHDLWGDFTLKALKKLKQANDDQQIPKIIVWSSNLSKRPYISKYLNKTFIVVQSWGASQWPDTPDLISDGYNVIISHVDAWYLDCGFGRWRETGDAACDPYRPWQTIYNHRPWHQFHLNKKQILGGEVCLWSEQLDENSLDARLWPRTAAFAERVWSDPQLDINSFTIQEDVYTRLNTQRERLVVRGINAEALWPTWCVQNPGMCL